MEPSPEQAIERIAELFGDHPGCRPAHARGVLCSGEFTPTAVARELTRAPHMQGESIRVTVRFSNAAGDPSVPDGKRDERGMATRFHYDGGHTDLVAVTLPCFFVRDPTTFMAMNRAFARVHGGTPKPRPAIGPFLLRHPEALRALAAMVMRKPVSSYAHCRYNAIHAFRWINEKGAEHYVRYSWIPDEGEVSISRLEGRQLARDQLQRDLWERLGRTPVQPIRFRLELQFASREELDRICDPTAVWGKKREAIVTAGAGDAQQRFVTVGALELNGLDEGSGEAIVFDPTRVPDGIEPSRDEILRFRPGVYEYSFGQRTQH